MAGDGWVSEAREKKQREGDVNEDGDGDGKDRVL